MRLLPALLCLSAASGCGAVGDDGYPPLLPLTPILAQAAPADRSGDAALEARAAGLRARAEALRRAEP